MRDVARVVISRLLPCPQADPRRSPISACHAAEAFSLRMQYSGMPQPEGTIAVAHAIPSQKTPLRIAGGRCLHPKGASVARRHDLNSRKEHGYPIACTRMQASAKCIGTRCVSSVQGQMEVRNSELLAGSGFPTEITSRRDQIFPALTDCEIARIRRFG